MEEREREINKPRREKKNKKKERKESVCIHDPTLRSVFLQFTFPCLPDATTIAPVHGMREGREGRSEGGTGVVRDQGV